MFGFGKPSALVVQLRADLAAADGEIERMRWEVEHANRLADLTMRRFDELLTRYHEATSPKPITVTTSNGVTVKARVLDPVAQKIRDEAGGDPRVMAHFQKYAAELKAAGKTAEEIVAAIGWQTGDPVPEP